MPDTVTELLEDDKAFDGFSRSQVAMLVTNPHLEDNPIVYVNQAFTRMTGYARSASIGRNCRFLQGDGTAKSDVDKLRLAVEAEESVTVDLLNYRANGEPFINRLIVAPVFDENGGTLYFVGIQKELREDDLSSRAEEINQQLMEIQDRVASDLSMIIGMIRQQSHATSVPEDFHALSRRIETMQLLYEEMKLSDSQSNRDSIQMGSFISRLCAAIAHIEGRSGIRLSLHIEALEVPIETATRVGLVVSELVTNAYSHAFDRMDMGLVEIRMVRLSEGGLRLSVSDDGIGIPSKREWPDHTTVGGRIVTGLIEGLEGTLHLTRGAAGSVITIDVPASATALD
jgi:PAS domain S-box-containing protein